MQNTIDEYLSSTNIEEVIIEIEELIEKEGMHRPICVGHFLIWSFTKKPQDFVKVYKMIIELFTKKNVTTRDIEEGTMVALANFYDTLIDSPNSPQQLKEMLEEFEKVKAINKELIQSAMTHIEEMKKQIDDEYKE